MSSPLSLRDGVAERPFSRILSFMRESYKSLGPFGDGHGLAVTYSAMYGTQRAIWVYFTSCLHNCMYIPSSMLDVVVEQHASLIMPSMWGSYKSLSSFGDARGLGVV